MEGSWHEAVWRPAWQGGRQGAEGRQDHEDDDGQGGGHGGSQFVVTDCKCCCLLMPFGLLTGGMGVACSFKSMLHSVCTYFSTR